MARRNLLYEAQVQAQAQVAPQFAALQEALTQARADRNAAIHTAAAASRGIGRAINRAGPQVRSAYRTGKLTAGTQRYASPAYAQAARNEQAVTGTALASSLGNALKELSDRRIEAVAGRAFRTQKAVSDYQTTVATINTRRQTIAGQQGLLAASAYSKLAEAQAQRDFQAQMKASEQAFSAHQNALSRRQQALTREAESSRQASTQAFQAHQNALGRRSSRRNLVYSQQQQNRRTQQRSTGQGSGPKPTASTVYAGRQKVQGATDLYTSVARAGSNGYKVPGENTTLHSMTEVHKFLAAKGYPQAVIYAASNLATKGYVAPREIQQLEQNFGIVVPKQWQGVRVRPHARKRPNRGRSTGTPRQGK